MLTIRQQQMDQMSAANGQPLVAPCNPTWIEIQLVDQDGNPVPNASYQLTLTDGTSRVGSLDENGLVRFDGIEEGQCQVSFPEFDDDEWRARDDSDSVPAPD